MFKSKIEDIVSICMMIPALVAMGLVAATEQSGLAWIGFVGAILCFLNVAFNISTLLGGGTWPSIKKGPAEAGPGDVSSPQGKIAPDGAGDFE